jgi:hypothetical protein
MATMPDQHSAAAAPLAARKEKKRTLQ